MVFDDDDLQFVTDRAKVEVVRKPANTATVDFTAHSPAASGIVQYFLGGPFDGRNKLKAQPVALPTVVLGSFF